MNLMTQRWWVMALRGALAIFFGLAAISLPGVILLALVALFGAYALVDGIFALIESFGRDSRHTFGTGHWWGLLFEGIVGVAIGILTFFWPHLTVMGLLYLIAFWAILTGVLELVTAFMLRHSVSGEWMMGLIGLLSIAFGLLLAVFPRAGALSVVWIIGAYALTAGVLMIALAFKLRSLGHTSGNLPHMRHVAPSH